MSGAPHDAPLSVPSPVSTGPLSRFEHDAMACRWEILILGDEPAYARQAAHAAFAEIDRLERELSRFIEHSDVARINRLRAGESLTVGIEALECLEVAAQIHKETHGAFDVTIGALLPPSPLNSSAATRRAAPPPFGMHLLAIDRPTRSVSVGADGLIVDLGAIGKGYAVDRVVAVLRDWSIHTALVHSGQSSVYALGSPPQQTGWTVAIRNPLDHSATLGEVCVRDCALGGSGVLLHGRHIIDPRTGTPAVGVLGTWALAPTTAAADALSTAYMVLTPAEVADYCRRHPEVSGLLYLETPAGYELHRFGPGFESVAVPGPSE